MTDEAAPKSAFSFANVHKDGCNYTVVRAGDLLHSVIRKDGRRNHLYWHNSMAITAEVIELAGEAKYA